MDFFREFHHVASDNCLLFKEQVNMILNSCLCCTSCLFDNFLFRRHKSQKKLRRQKSFSPKICVLQASNLNFIDSLFSCRDNGGFLAELNSDLRIEAFTSLIMVSMIHICLCLVINDGFVTNIPGWKLVKWRQPLVVRTLRLSRRGTYCFSWDHCASTRVIECQNNEGNDFDDDLMFVNKQTWRWLPSGEVMDATALSNSTLIDWAPGRWEIL